MRMDLVGRKPVNRVSLMFVKHLVMANLSLCKVVSVEIVFGNKAVWQCPCVQLELELVAPFNKDKSYLTSVHGGRSEKPQPTTQISVRNITRINTPNTF